MLPSYVSMFRCFDVQESATDSAAFRSEPELFLLLAARHHACQRVQILSEKHIRIRRAPIRS